MDPLQADQLIIDIPDRASGSALNFTIGPGQIWGVLGPNGAGKTTLLHTLAGLRAPRSGAVRLGERSLTAMSAEACRSSWVWCSRNARTAFRQRFWKRH